MDSVAESESIDAAQVITYLEGGVSSSVAYILTLFQPLKEDEIRRHPYRLQYLRLSGYEGKPDLGETLRLGRECGLLVALSDGREDFFFLNSDLAIRPPPLGKGEAAIEVESGTEDVESDVHMPSGCHLSRDHPIPLLRDPSAMLGWFQWLSEDGRRNLLMRIQEEGPQTEDELLRATGLGSADIKAGLRCGVLKSRDEKLDFQFSGARIPPDGQPWTAKPPKFWFSRSREPLACVEGIEDRLHAEPAASPTQLLVWASEKGKMVVPSKRREHLRLNLLYRPTAVIPRIEDLGPETIPTAWENRRGMVYPVTEGYERALAICYLYDELQPEGEEEQDWRREALRSLATRKLERYFRAKEKELKSRIGRDPESTYGLGPHAIMSVASTELEREGLVAERKYFEKFLELLAE